MSTTTILLWVATALIPIIALAAWFDYRRCREYKRITHTELLAGMRALDLERPVASRIEGDPNWVDPKKRRRKRKPVEVNVTPIRKVGGK